MPFLKIDRRHWGAPVKGPMKDHDTFPHNVINTQYQVVFTDSPPFLAHLPSPQAAPLATSNSCHWCPAARATFSTQHARNQRGHSPNRDWLVSLVYEYRELCGGRVRPPGVVPSAGRAENLGPGDGGVLL